MSVAHPDGMGVIGALCVVAAIVSFILFIAYYLEKKRREALDGYAQRRGFMFRREGLFPESSEVQRMPLLINRQAASLKNVMRKAQGPFTVTVFDYQYVTGCGKQRTVHKQTVFAYEALILKLPAFTMRPEGFFDKLAGVCGFQDIDFSSNEEFSKSYVLQGDNEFAIREIFNEEVLGFFASHRKVCVEARGNVLIIFIDGNFLPLGDFDTMFAETREAAELFAKASGR